MLLWALVAPLHPGGMLDRKVHSREQDFARAGRMTVWFDLGTNKALILATLGLENIAPGLVGDEAIVEWHGPMPLARLNHIARTTGILSIEAFEVTTP